MAAIHFFTTATWAEHRFDSTVIIERIGCNGPGDEERVVVDAYTLNVLGSSDGIAAHLLADTDPMYPWDFYVMDVGGPPIQKVLSETIRPGRNLLNLSLSSTCTWRFSVMGIGMGERFRIGGPCVVQTDVNYTFPLILTGDNQQFPPITDGASELTVKKAGSLSPFKLQENVVSSGRIPSPVSGELKGFEDGGAINDLAFLTPGEYELEVVWKMSSPPGGGVLKEVSRTKKHITVLPASSINITPTSPAKVKPSNLPGATPLDGTVDIRMQVVGIGSYRAAFLAERQGGTGGHEADHHAFNGNQLRIDRWGTHPNTPIGSFVLSEFNDASGGIALTVYRASEFGGKERVRIFMVQAGKRFAIKDASGTVIPGLDAEVSLSGLPLVEQQRERQRILKAVVDHPDFDGCQLGLVEIKVQVPNLVELTADSDFDLVGAQGQTKCDGTPVKSAHKYNHWGRQSTVNAVNQIADSWIASGFISSSYRLRMNDISVGDATEGFGGGFDVGNHWGADLNPPPAPGHQSHRRGTNADIQYAGGTISAPVCGMSGTPKAKLKQIIWRATGKEPLFHDGHFHTK